MTWQVPPGSLWTWQVPPGSLLPGGIKNKTIRKTKKIAKFIDFLKSSLINNQAEILKVKFLYLLKIIIFLIFKENLFC